MIPLEERAQVLDMSLDLICIAGTDGYFKYVNSAWEKVLGYSEDDLLSRSFFSFIYPEDHRKSDAEVEKLARGETTIDFENRYLHKDGSVRTISWRATSLPDKGLMYCIGRDITEQKRMEEKLRESLENVERSRRTLSSALENERLAKEATMASQAFLDRIIEHSPFPMFVADERGTLLRCNSALREALNVTDEQIVGRYNLLKDMNLRDKGVMPLVKGVFEKKIVARFSIDWTGARGGDADFRGSRDVFIDASIFPILNAEGRITNVVCQWVDITEQRKAENRLERINRTFLGLSEDFEKNIELLTSLCGELLEADCALYNRLEGDVLCSRGQWHLPEGYNPKDRPDGHVCFDVIQKETDEVHIVEHLDRTKYAETDPNVKAYGLRTYIGKAVKRGGKNIGSLCAVFARDHTPSEDDKRVIGIIATAMGNEEDRKMVDSALREFKYELEGRVAARTRDLQEAYKEMEAFSYSVSHDLRAPLRAMAGFSEALLEDYAEVLDRKGRDYLMRIYNAGKEMGVLIDDILNLARITRSEMTMDDIDLSAAVELIADDLRRSDPSRHVEVSIQPGLVVFADRQLITDALENLIENAWKFSSKNPSARIEFGSFKQEGKTVYYVKDNGVGFDMAYADKLFRPFQRLHAKDEFPGTGIGLATVQRIVNRHGGRVWAEGKVNAGATLYFTLQG